MMLRVLIKKQMLEHLSAFKKNRKNVDFVGILLTVLLAGLTIFAVSSVFSQFIEKYCAIRINNVLDVNARYYEIMTILYEFVLIVSVLGATSQLARAIFENDDRNVLITLPIKSYTIFLSKILSVYFSQAVLSLCVSVPLVIIFTTVIGGNAGIVFLSIVAGLILPVISLSIASVLCLPFYFIKRALQSKYVIFLLVVTAIAGLAFWGYSEVLAFFEGIMTSGEIQFFFSGERMVAIIRLTKNLVPANYLARFVLSIEPWKNLGILLAIIVGLGVCAFFLVYLLYNKAVKIRVQNSDGIFFAPKKLGKPRSIVWRLFEKELGAIMFTPDYAFQYLSVAAILPVMVYFCMEIGAKMLISIVHIEANFEIAIFLTLLFGSLTNTFCAINISREGPSFYMQKTLPIKHSQFIGVKIVLNFIVSVVSVGISSIVISALEYVTPGESAFIFFVGIVMSLAQICFATRLDLNHPHFSTEEDNTVKESNSNVSVIIILGMISSVIMGGIPLFALVMTYFDNPIPAYATYLFVGGLSLIILAASLTFTFVGLKAKFDRISEAD